MTSPHFPTLTGGACFAVYPLAQNEEWNPVSIQFETGHTEIRPRPRGKPKRRWAWHGQHLLRADLDAVMGFLTDRKGGGNFFYIDNPAPIPVWSPYDAPTVSTSTSGAITGRTIYAAIAYSDGTDTTNVSQETTQVVAGNDLAVLTAPGFFPRGATSIRIYLGVSSGTLTFAGIESTEGGTWTEPYSTVDVDSNSGQKILSIASTTDFESGQSVIIGEGTAREETKIIDTVQGGVSITMTANLTYTHTQVQADKVYLDYGTGTAAPSANALEGEEIKVRLAAMASPTLIATNVWSLILELEEMF
ncbi:MAG: hypothetical protein U9Q07_08545 [Planctomycetota bacterium]|nr:hypothetical protein [Planctomycetota bacterium]